MQQVTLVGHTNDRDRIVQKLHTLGILQLKDLKGSKIDLQSILPSEEVKEGADLLLRVAHLNSILQLAPRKLHWKQKLYGLETMKRGKHDRLSAATVRSTAKTLLKECEAPLLQLEEQHQSVLDQLQGVADAKRVITTLERHGLPVAVLRETKSIQFVTGRIQTQHLKKFQHEAEKELQGLLHIDARKENKKESIITIIGLKESLTTLNFLVKKYGIMTFAGSHIPDVDDPAAWVQEEEARLKKEKQQIVKQVAKQLKFWDRIIFIREELELLKERGEAVNKLKASQQFFLLQGWVTAEEEQRLRKGIPEAHITSAPAQPEQNPPVVLKNSKFLRPFEILTELYALPKYKDLDPTFIVGPIFLVYAGFMLTDFIYGLGLVLLGGVLYKLFKEHAAGTRDISISIMGIGIFSMLFGVLTGSYLGDAPKYFFGLETAEIALWKDPLADPLYFLLISLAVGLAHLNIGLILGTIEDLRKRAWKTLVSDRVVWWLLQLGILALVLQYSMLGKVLLGITVLLVILLKGPLGLLDMTGFMGDVISYSRLFALALSTAGIAMTVNLLAEMLYGVPYVGFLLAALIFIAGHLFSFAMNALGSFVHSIRLQFVEFFGKFYEGGGDKFTPFKEERIYTEVRE